MTTPAIPCPWWCTDHRVGDSAEDEQHARLFPVTADGWVAILWGTQPTDRVELAFQGEGYARSPDEVRVFVAALQEAAELFERILAEQG